MDLHLVFYTCMYALISGCVASILHYPLCRYALLGFTASISTSCIFFKFCINRSYNMTKQLSSEMVHAMHHTSVLELCCFCIANSFSLQREINLNYLETWILCPICSILMTMFINTVEQLPKDVYPRIWYMEGTE